MVPLSGSTVNGHASQQIRYVTAMVRLVRDGESYDLWAVSTSDAEQLWSRENDGEPVLVPTTWKFSVDRELTAALLERLTTGWRRVRDPEREVECDEPFDPELDAAMRANWDPATALVYADWYQQHNQHPRGELIALQVARAKQPEDPALAEAEAALLAREHDRLLGPIGVKPESYHLGLELTWEYGFVTAVRISGQGKDSQGEQLLWDVLRHPSTRFLRELVIGCFQFGDQDNQLIAALLFHAGPRPPLRKLVLADFDDTFTDNIDISRAWLGDLSALSERYPLLEDVVIKGRSVGSEQPVPHGGLASLALVHCRRFAVRTSGMRAAMLAAIAGAPWPELVELEVWTGTTEYGSDCTLADVQKLLAQLPPKLRVLRILDNEFTDELVPHLIAAHAAHPLDELDVSLGTLTDKGAQVLLDRAGELAGLARLRIFDNCVGPAMLERLRASTLPIVEAAPFPGEGWDQSDYDRTNGQKNERYVSVSE